MTTSYTFGRICESRITATKKKRKQTSHLIINKVNNAVSQRLETFSERLFPQWRGSNMVSVSLLCLCLIFPPTSLIPLGREAVEIPSFYKNRAVLRTELCSIILCHMHVRYARMLTHPRSTCWMSLTVAHWY